MLLTNVKCHTVNIKIGNINITNRACGKLFGSQFDHELLMNKYSEYAKNLDEKFMH